MPPATYDLYFTGSKGNPRQCIVIGEDVEPVFYRFETPDVYMTNTRTTVFRNQGEVAAFDWTASQYLGLVTILNRPAFPMSQLVLQGSTQSSRAFMFGGDKFEWRRGTQEPLTYDLYAPQGIRIASFRREELNTPVGPAHGFMQYTFVHPPLLLECLLALCVNRWIDTHGL